MVTSVDDTIDDDDYDEFALLHENAAEWDLPFDGPPAVERRSIEVEPGRLSYLRWGTGEPDLVLLHGGGQNAHTWDTVALALGRPLVAIDLPGHGHSYRRDDRDYGPWANAEAVAEAVASVAPGAAAVVGMSLGGATAIRLASQWPGLCRRVVLVDVTPQVNDATRDLTTAERGSVALISGPPLYDSFEEMADATVRLSPHRAPSGVRRGVRHNAYRRPDGKWTWRYDLFGPRQQTGPDWSDFSPLWDDVARLAMPTMLVRGGLSPFVRDEDAAEMQRRLPGVRVELVEGAGHAVQSDRPLELVRLIEAFALSRSKHRHPARPIDPERVHPGGRALDSNWRSPVSMTQSWPKRAIGWTERDTARSTALAGSRRETSRSSLPSSAGLISMRAAPRMSPLTVAVTERATSISSRRSTNRIRYGNGGCTTQRQCSPAAKAVPSNRRSQGHHVA